MRTYDGPGPGRKACPSCGKFVHIALRACECGHEFVRKPLERPKEAPTVVAQAEPAAPVLLAPTATTMTREDFLGHAILSIIHQQYGFSMLGWGSFGDLVELAGSAYVAWRALSGAKDEELWALKKEFQAMQAYYSGEWLEKDPSRTRGGDFGDGVPIRDLLSRRAHPSQPHVTADRSSGFTPGTVPSTSSFPEIPAETTPEDDAEFEAWEQAEKGAVS